MAWVLALIGLALLALVHEAARRLAARRWRHAIAIPIAVFAHYLAITAVAFGYCMTYGIATGAYVQRIVEVVPGYDAEGKLARGDIVRAVDHGDLTSYLTDHVNRANGAPVVLTIERAGRTLDVTVQPRHDDAKGRWLLGVRPRLEPILDHAPASAARVAFALPVYAVKEFAHDTGELVAGSETADPGGPARIVGEYPARPIVETAWALVLRAALFALLLQLVVDVIRARRR